MRNWADDFNTYADACRFYGCDTPDQLQAEADAMGTYDTIGGTPASPDEPAYQPSDLVTAVLGLLEDADCPSSVNDQIVALIEKWEREKTIPF